MPVFYRFMSQPGVKDSGGVFIVGEGRLVTPPGNEPVAAMKTFTTSEHFYG